ncbi:hypothetical protein ACJRO7_002433 [Eucalyptus globulus]|uniref:Uncharacterized protein n=1 Tax=Eucalyptus globulus TaxID=34317 RepID=A0ABD3LVH4_EUCGL
MWLDINHNKIDGAMPEAMKDLLLQFSDLSCNRLCGEIPVGERSKSFGYSVYFHNRCLCGVTRWEGGLNCSRPLIDNLHLMSAIHSVHCS